MIKVKQLKADLEQYPDHAYCALANFYDYDKDHFDTQIDIITYSVKINKKGFSSKAKTAETCVVFTTIDGE